MALTLAEATSQKIEYTPADISGIVQKHADRLSAEYQNQQRIKASQQGKKTDGIKASDLERMKLNKLTTNLAAQTAYGDDIISRGQAIKDAALAGAMNSDNPLQYLKNGIELTDALNKEVDYLNNEATSINNLISKDGVISSSGGILSLDREIHDGYVNNDMTAMHNRVYGKYKNIYESKNPGNEYTSQMYINDIQAGKIVEARGFYGDQVYISDPSQLVKMDMNTIGDAMFGSLLDSSKSDIYTARFEEGSEENTVLMNAIQNAGVEGQSTTLVELAKTMSFNEGVAKSLITNLYNQYERFVPQGPGKPSLKQVQDEALRVFQNVQIDAENQLWSLAGKGKFTGSLSHLNKPDSYLYWSNASALFSENLGDAVEVLKGLDGQENNFESFLSEVRQQQINDIRRKEGTKKGKPRKFAYQALIDAKGEKRGDVTMALSKIAGTQFFDSNNPIQQSFNLNELYFPELEVTEGVADAYDESKRNNSPIISTLPSEGGNWFDDKNAIDMFGEVSTGYIGYARPTDDGFEILNDGTYNNIKGSADFETQMKQFVPVVVMEVGLNNALKNGGFRNKGFNSDVIHAYHIEELTLNNAADYQQLFGGVQNFIDMELKDEATNQYKTATSGPQEPNQDGEFDMLDYSKQKAANNIIFK